MCGRLNVIDDASVVELCQQLGLPNMIMPEPLYQSAARRFVRATEYINIVIQTDNGYQLVPAIWWLLLDKHMAANGQPQFKPSRYTSFNTRYDKLNQPGSAGYAAFREQRCILVVNGFGETQKRGNAIEYTDFTAHNDERLVLGGVYRHWGAGNPLSFSVITTPALAKLKMFHEKASPLILPQHDDTIKQWLDPDFREVEHFQDLLFHPQLPQNIIAHAIDKPSRYQAIAEPQLINADQQY